VQAAAEPHALIIAGPTCSGKSALALSLAERMRGTIINADSMQVYRELRVLTARPSPEEEARAPHLLYGVRPAALAGSVAWWREEALRAMEQTRAESRLPILCGGTGLYFASLTEGLAEIPDSGPAAREEARALLAEIGPAALHSRLAAVDPETAARLRPSDSQRIARAWEVWRSTGMGLAKWHARPPVPPAKWRFFAILLNPPRGPLKDAIAARFQQMLDAGALDEVRALMALGLDPALPAMRAHGVPELMAHLRGQIALEDARSRAVLVTRRYTKRQATWYRHHPLAPMERTLPIHARGSSVEQLSETELGALINFVQLGG
jgi:tRNA dimethylallyltransferase